MLQVLPWKIRDITKTKQKQGKKKKDKLNRGLSVVSIYEKKTKLARLQLAGYEKNLHILTNLRSQMFLCISLSGKRRNRKP